MFLDRLNENEKVLFLDLSVYAAQCNGVVEDSEKDMLLQYCREMGIAFYDVSKLHELAEVKESFSSSDDLIKRIVVLELLGLCYADGDFDNVEKAFVSDFANSIGVSEEIYQKLNRDVEEYLTILGIIQDHIME